MTAPNPDLQQAFADRLAETFESATRLMPAVEVFESALGAACGFALQHAHGPAVAETLRQMAGSLLSHRGGGSQEH